MLSQQNAAFRSHFGAKNVFSRYVSRVSAGSCSVYTCSSDVVTVIGFFYLKELWSHFFSSTVFLSSTTGEVYICRSVFDNCAVHLGFIFF